MEFTMTKSKDSIRSNSEHLNLDFQAIGSLFFYEHMCERGKALSSRAMKWILGTQIMKPLSVSTLLTEKGSGRRLIIETLILQYLITLCLSLSLCQTSPSRFFSISICLKDSSPWWKASTLAFSFIYQ